MKALFSIHDVMPETLGAVTRILRQCETDGCAPLCLLVVPGRDWDAEGLDTLRTWARRGHELAAHGWVHHTRPRRIYHRIHSLLISRDVAEHLEHSAAGVIALMQRSGAWFAEHGFSVPRFYVPPAWALGALPASSAKTLPYERIETTRGFRFPHSGKRTRLPLVGFEADTRLRATFLTLWNHQQIRKARRTGTPLRISIHPNDLNLRLSPALGSLLKQPWTPILPGSISAP